MRRRDEDQFKGPGNQRHCLNVNNAFPWAWRRVCLLYQYIPVVQTRGELSPELDQDSR